MTLKSLVCRGLIVDVEPNLYGKVLKPIYKARKTKADKQPIVKNCKSADESDI